MSLAMVRGVDRKNFRGLKQEGAKINFPRADRHAPPHLKARAKNLVFNWRNYRLLDRADSSAFFWEG